MYGNLLLFDTGIVDIPWMKRLAGETDNLGEFSKPNNIFPVLGVIAGGIAFSVILFKLTSPQISESLKELSPWESLS